MAVFITLLFSRCVELSPPSGTDAPYSHVLVFSTSDFNTGFLNVLSLDDFSLYPDIAPVSPDNRVWVFQNSAYVLNRYGYDNIQKFSMTEGYRNVYEESIGRLSNPYGISFLNDQYGFISLYGDSHAALVNLFNGKPERIFSLSSVNDADGIPESAAVYLKDNKIYLLIQNQNRNNSPWLPAATAKMVVYDKTSMMPEDIKNVPCSNPDTSIHEYADILYFGCPGQWNSPDGKLLSYNPATETFGEIFNEAQAQAALSLSGALDITNLEVLAQNHFIFTAYTDNFGKSLLVEYRAGIFRLIRETTNGYFSDLEINPDYLFVADRNFTCPGLHIYHRSDISYFRFIPTGLPPYSLGEIP